MIKQATLLVAMATLISSSLARPNGDQEAAIAAADQELIAQESSSSARSLESYTDLDKGAGKYELGPKFIKYNGMKCLMDDTLPLAPSSVNKRSLKPTSSRRSAGAVAGISDSSATSSASDTASNLFNMENLLSAISVSGSSSSSSLAGLGLEGLDLSNLGNLGNLGALTGSSNGSSSKAKPKNKNNLLRFNFMKRILEVIGLFVKVATDDKFLKDGNFLDFIKLCRETLLGFEKFDR